MENNQQIFTQSKVVAAYSKVTALQPAEKTIFGLLENSFADTILLDIGIGAGRTTRYFLPRVKKYSGIDYAESMTRYCIEHFQDQHAEFLTADVRNMSVFPDNKFDFVVFSFNGIDFIKEEDRGVAFEEMKRVLRPGGTLVFSSHNTRNIQRKYKFRIPRNPLNFLSERKKYNTLRKINGKKDQYEGKSYFSFYDGAEDFTICNGYIQPEFQASQLTTMGFEDVRFFNRVTGVEIQKSDLKNYYESWTYYLCRKKR